MINLKDAPLETKRKRFNYFIVFLSLVILLLIVL